MSEDAQKSVAWVVVALAIAVALFGWGFMAGVYATDVEGYRAEASQSIGRRRSARLVSQGVGAFVATAFRQIPNAPAVFAHNFQNRLWLPIAILVAEAGVVASGFGLKRLEAKLDAPVRRRRSR